MASQLPSQSWEVVDHFDLDKYIEQCFGRPWSLQQNGMFDNGSIQHFTVEPNPFATTIVAEWLLSPVPKAPGRLEQPDFGESFQITTDEILNELCNRGLLDEGNLIIHVWW